jgi:iron complex outermembrane recepter protein
MTASAQIVTETTLDRRAPSRHDTFNPRFGATFKPVDWVSIRGAWGESFVAPSLADNELADPIRIFNVSAADTNAAAVAAGGFPPPAPGQNRFVVLGSVANLEPQTATTWSVGADIVPPFIPGLKLSGTYYNIKYNDIIQLVPFSGPNQLSFFTLFAPIAFTLAPIQAQLDSFTSKASSIIGNCAPEPDCVWGIIDARKRNLGQFKQDGIDFALTYNLDTAFGGVDFGVAGSHILSRKNAPVAGEPFVPETAISDLAVRSTIGTQIGNLRAQAAWNYTRGFDLDVPVGISGQTKVDSFNTVDLFFKYDLPSSVLADTSFTLTDTNVFDEDPPSLTAWPPRGTSAVS